MIPCLRHSADTVKLRVSLEHVKQRVHGLCRNHSVFRKLVVLNLPEFPVKGFPVTDRIRAFFLDEMKQPLCQL